MLPTNSLRKLSVRARQRTEREASQRRIATLANRADRLAGEKVMLRDRLEKFGEALAEINQQLLVRALCAITGMWLVTPPLKAGES